MNLKYYPKRVETLAPSEDRIFNSLAARRSVYTDKLPTKISHRSDNARIKTWDVGISKSSVRSIARGYGIQFKL